MVAVSYTPQVSSDSFGPYGTLESCGHLHVKVNSAVNIVDVGAISRMDIGFYVEYYGPLNILIMDSCPLGLTAHVEPGVYICIYMCMHIYICIYAYSYPCTYPSCCLRDQPPRTCLKGRSCFVVFSLNGLEPWP